MIVFKDNNKIRVFNKIFFNQKKNLKNLNYIMKLILIMKKSYLNLLII